MGGEKRSKSLQTTEIRELVRSSQELEIPSHTGEAFTGILNE
jgi:hypothetical protein